MQIDTDWLSDNFRQLNTRYFGGELPCPRFHIGRSRTRLGSLSYKRGFMSPQTFTLSMSNYYNQTENQFRNVLLHEMIHLYIAAKGIRDTSAHGTVFRKIMACLNGEGWDISVTTSMRGTPKAQTNQEGTGRQHLVLAIETTDGRRFLSSVNPRFAKTLDKRLRRTGEVSRYAWYTSDDRWFEDMPRVRSLRGRRVDEETYGRLTAAMKSVDI